MMAQLINNDGGIVNVADVLVEAYISAGFKPAEAAPVEEKSEKKSKKKAKAKK